VGVHWRGGERSGVDEGATREADIEMYRREKARNRAICSKSCQPHIRSSTWLAKHDLPIKIKRKERTRGVIATDPHRTSS
jgi:hypothetical protein